MDFFDAHIHFFFEGPIEPLFDYYANIEGFRGGCLLIFDEAPEDHETVLAMIPTAYRHQVTDDTIHPGEDAIAFFKDKTPSFIPYLDTRYFGSKHARNLERYRDKGFRGVKILYVPETDEQLGFDGWEQALGRSVAESEQVTADLMAECERLRLPVLFHVDLRRYGDFVSELLSAYPEVNVNIPHFGSSRKKMAGFLEEHGNCYTDFSSLLPYMKEAPDAYLGFIGSFRDRILFGSDEIFGMPSVLRDYIEYTGLLFDDDLKEKVFLENYTRFHQ